MQGPKEVEEHFESRNFTVTEAAVHTRNAQDAVACVHFHNEEERFLAIRKTDGSLLYDRKIALQPCCCRRTLRENGYGKRPFPNASNVSANRSCRCVKSTSASNSSSIEERGSQAPSTVLLPNSEAPTLSKPPAPTVKAANSEALTVSIAPGYTTTTVNGDAPSASITPNSTITAVKHEALTISNTSVPYIPDTNSSYIVAARKRKAPEKKDQLKCSPTAPVATESATTSENRTNSRLSREVAFGPSPSKILGTAPCGNETNIDVHASGTGTAASSMPLFVAFPFHELNITPSFHRENTITLSGEFPLCRCTESCRFQSGAC